MRNGLDNRKIKWTGKVVETRQWHEDDYVPAAGMLVDLDGTPGPDAMVKISEADFARMKAGMDATFVAYINGIVDEAGKPILKLKADKGE